MDRVRSAPRRAPLVGAALLALALLASACGAADTELAAPGDGARLDPSVLTGEATTWTGETFDLSTVAGKDLVVWFWAPW